MPMLQVSFNFFSNSFKVSLLAEGASFSPHNILKNLLDHAITSYSCSLNGATMTDRKKKGIQGEGVWRWRQFELDMVRSRKRSGRKSPVYRDAGVISWWELQNSSFQPSRGRLLYIHPVVGCRLSSSRFVTINSTSIKPSVKVRNLTFYIFGESLWCWQPLGTS